MMDKWSRLVQPVLIIGIRTVNEDNTITDQIDRPNAEVYYYGKFHGEYFITKDGVTVWDVDTLGFFDDEGNDYQCEEIGIKWNSDTKPVIFELVRKAIMEFIGGS